MSCNSGPARNSAGGCHAREERPARYPPARSCRASAAGPEEFADVAPSLGDLADEIGARSFSGHGRIPSGLIDDAGDLSLDQRVDHGRIEGVELPAFGAEFVDIGDVSGVRLLRG